MEFSRGFKRPDAIQVTFRGRHIIKGQYDLKETSLNGPGVLKV